MFRSRLVTVVLPLVLLATWLTACGTGAASRSYPDRPIWLVNPSTSGGSTEALFRAVNDVSQRERIFPHPFVIVTDNAGSGIAAQAQTAATTADGYTLTVANNNTIFQDLSGEAPVGYREFTYIARLSVDYSGIAVPANSKFKTFKELVDAARVAPGQITVSGSRTGSVDHADLLRINKTTGVRFNYLGATSGTQALRNMTTGQADAAITNPVDIVDALKEGKYRLLMIGSADRLDGLTGVPTMRELGYDMVMEKFRGMAGPKGMSPDVVHALELRFKQIADVPAWKTDYLAKYQQVDGYQDSATFTKYMDDQYRVAEQLFREIGLLKK